MYKPAFSKTFSGLASLENEPSPKSHVYELIEPDDTFANEMACPVKGVVVETSKSASMAPPIRISSVFVACVPFESSAMVRVTS